MRPENHVTGDVGQKAVSLLLTEWDWTADLIASDYGEDLDCHVYIDGRRTPLHFRCQVKSSLDAENKVRRLKDGTFSIRIGAETCRAWLLAYYPVLLIVYDRASKTAYWADATAQVRAQITSLSQKELTLHVSAEHVLEQQQTQVMSMLTSFYSQLLKVHSQGVERTVFPVLMPGYRVVPSINSGELLRVGLGRDDRPAPVSVHRDALPAWTTALRTLDGQFLAGMSFRVPSADLAQFSELLQEELLSVAPTRGEGEWLAFVCSPIRFSIQQSADDGDVLGRDLSGWWSYAKIGDVVVSDHAYAFEPPLGFIRQIGKRARSWSGYHFVSREHDVAVQLLAGVATTPADTLFQSMLRKHLLGQFLAWECPRAELETLQHHLWSADLIFAPVEVDEPGLHDSDLVEGAISTPMFAPAIGLIPQARTWAELEQGTVRSRIEDAGLFEHLPGREGSSDLNAKLLGLLDHLAQNVPERWIVDGTSPDPGMPIDLSARQVVVQRFQAHPGFDPARATIDLTERLSELAGAVQHTDSLTPYAAIIESFEEIAVVSISWAPPLDESSATAVQKALVEVVALFDCVLPRATESPENLATTLEVLRFAGELYFEGDRLY